MRRTAAALVLASLVQAGGWPQDMDGFRRDWSLAPASAPRKGIWLSSRISSASARILVYADSTAGRDVRAMDWWAESGARDIDLPDDAFWGILDGLSGNKEWTESDPGALGPEIRKGLEGEPAQGFLCRSCEPRLEAATWVSHGTTRLRVARLKSGGAARSTAVGLSPGLTADGIRSLAGQKGLSVLSVNPCREGGGECVMDLSGPKGQKWIFRRGSGNDAWSSLEASFQAGPWWSAEWNWDSLRIQSRREFAELLTEWLSADADVAARTLLGPVEPVLSFPVSAWLSRSLPGMRIAAVADSFSRLTSPPSNFQLVRSPALKASVDAFGRRTIQVGK